MNKKIIFSAAIIAALGLGMQSCEDFLDIQPTDLLDTGTALETLDDFNKGLLGAYSVTTSGAYLGGNYMTLPSILADDARISRQNRGQFIQIYEWQYTAGDGTIEGVWNTIYRMIDRANIIIEQIDKLPDSEEKNRILGEALSMRAMGHFDLLRFFAKHDPNNSATLGIPYMLRSQIGEPARDPITVVYENIVSDLTEAIELMPAGGPITQFTPLAAKALLARVSLYREDWANAKKYAAEVISAKSLANPAEFRAMFQKDEAGEVLYKVAMQPGNARIGETLYERANDNAFVNPTEDLLALYNPDADVRFDVYYQVRAGKETLVAKYFGRDIATNSGLTDIKVLRVAEMYLIRAEANFRLNDQASALADLNALRSARIVGFDPSLAQNQEQNDDLLAAIFTERRKEFAFEGHRWFDLRRLDMPVVRGEDCNSQNECTLPKNNFKLIWPIPQSEVFANKNIQQNPGYDN